MQQIRAITLDLDDTLWEIEPVIQRAEAALWSWLADNYPRIADNFSTADIATLRESVMNEFSDKCHDFRFLRKKTLQRMADRSGYSTDLVEPAFVIFDHERNKVDLFPDVLTTLQSLNEDFVLLAVTNGNADLGKIGIKHFFRHVVTATEVGSAKPDAKIFDVAIRLSGVAASEILHVGDHPETDVCGARQCGMQTAWMNRTSATWPQHLQRPDVVVTNCDELRVLLQSAVVNRRQADGD